MPTRAQTTLAAIVVLCALQFIIHSWSWTDSAPSDISSSVTLFISTTDAEKDGTTHVGKKPRGIAAVPLFAEIRDEGLGDGGTKTLLSGSSSLKLMLPSATWRSSEMFYSGSMFPDVLNFLDDNVRESLEELRVFDASVPRADRDAAVQRHLQLYTLHGAMAVMADRLAASKVCQRKGRSDCPAAEHAHQMVNFTADVRSKCDTPFPKPPKQPKLRPSRQMSRAEFVSTQGRQVIAKSTSSCDVEVMVGGTELPTAWGPAGWMFLKHWRSNKGAKGPIVKVIEESDGKYIVDFRDDVEYVWARCGTRNVAGVTLPPILPKRAPVSKLRKPNVVFVMLDSLSLPMLSHAMPKTKRAMATAEELGVGKLFNFGHHTGNAQFSIFNYFSAFTGVPFAGYVRTHRMGYPWIWKDYQDAGYVTMVSHQVCGMLNDVMTWDLSAFERYLTVHQPGIDAVFPTKMFCDVSKRMDVRRNTLKTSIVAGGCEIPMFFGGKWAYDHIINYFYQFRDAAGQQPYMATFIMEDTHDSSMAAPFKVDAQYARAIASLLETVGEEAVVVFMSDHGISYNQYYDSGPGQVDNKMPHFMMSVPNWLLEGCAAAGVDIAAAMMQNTNLLTTHFDIHATLRHLTQFGSHTSMESACKPIVPSPAALLPGIPPPTGSVMAPLPATRSCLNVPVDAHFCQCLDPQFRPLNVDHAIATTLGKVLVNHVNFESHKARACCCAELALTEVVSVKVVRLGSVGDETVVYSATIVVNSLPANMPMDVVAPAKDDETPDDDEPSEDKEDDDGDDDEEDETDDVARKDDTGDDLRQRALNAAMKNGAGGKGSSRKKDKTKSHKPAPTVWSAGIVFAVNAELVFPAPNVTATTNTGTPQPFVPPSSPPASASPPPVLLAASVRQVRRVGNFGTKDKVRCWNEDTGVSIMYCVCKPDFDNEASKSAKEEEALHPWLEAGYTPAPKMYLRKCYRNPYVDYLYDGWYKKNPM